MERVGACVGILERNIGARERHKDSVVFPPTWQDLSRMILMVSSGRRTLSLTCRKYGPLLSGFAASLHHLRRCAGSFRTKVLTLKLLDIREMVVPHILAQTVASLWSQAHKPDLKCKKRKRDSPKGLKPIIKSVKVEWRPWRGPPKSKVPPSSSESPDDLPFDFIV